LSFQLIFSEDGTSSFYTAKGVIHAALTSESSKCGKSVNIIMNAFAGPNHSDLKNDSCL